MASANDFANRLVILRGDDTGGTLGRALVFTITTDGTASLDGCRAEWEFDGIVKRIDAPLVEGEPREVFYSHNETRCMRLGVRFGTLRVIDAAGKVRTFDNTKPVEVTDKVSRAYPGSSQASVIIGAGVTWEQIAGKPKLVKTINGEEPDAQGNINIASGGTVKSATVNGGEKVTPDASGNLALTVESVPSDYDAVRTNAATGAAHAAKRGSGTATDANPHGATASDIPAGPGVSVAEAISYAENAGTGARTMIERHEGNTSNPHATTAEQVGVRVVELVVEGDAKKLYLMSNGERTTERVTSYAALLAMAKRGLVRMYYNAVGGTGRKALYTAHMVDDNGTPAMRFDATGTLGEKVYTRSIALTKSGTDGIAVTIGDLTEIQKALTSTQIANIADVTNKIAKDDVVAPNNRAINGEAADARETFFALVDRRDKTDNICAKDSVGVWSIPAPIIIDGVTHTFDGTQPTRKDGYLTLDYWKWTDNQGGHWLGPLDEKATDGIFYGDEFALYSFSSSCATVAKEGESYVTQTGVSNIVKTDAETRTAITTLAEASSQVNASTALALKDRDCCLVAFAANMTFTFTAKETGKTGLRSFEVIVTGCVKDGAVNWPAVTYRGDSTDLIPEDGDNHWTFAEQQDGSFAVTRHVANTFTIGE